MKTTRLSDDAVKNATGRDWAAWRRLLDRMGAADLPHREIATRLGAEHGIAPWWRQTITVEYERAIGRRAVGQRCDGAFDASASRTLPMSQDEAFAAWVKRAKRHGACDGVEPAGPPRITRTEKWRYWRLSFADGSRVTVSSAAKGDGKAVLTADHQGIATKAATARWKAYWRERLAELP